MAVTDPGSQSPILNVATDALVGSMKPWAFHVFSPAAQANDTVTLVDSNGKHIDTYVLGAGAFDAERVCNRWCDGVVLSVNTGDRAKVVVKMRQT